MELFYSTREFLSHLTSILFRKNDQDFIHLKILVKINDFIFKAKFGQFFQLNKIAIEYLLIRIQCLFLIKKFID